MTTTGAQGAPQPESAECEHEWEFWITVDDNGTGTSYAECNVCGKRDNVVIVPIKYESHFRGKHKVMTITVSSEETNDYPPFIPDTE